MTTGNIRKHIRHFGLWGIFTAIYVQTMTHTKYNRDCAPFFLLFLVPLSITHCGIKQHCDTIWERCQSICNTGRKFNGSQL